MNLLVALVRDEIRIRELVEPSGSSDTPPGWEAEQDECMFSRFACADNGYLPAHTAGWKFGGRINQMSYTMEDTPGFLVTVPGTCPKRDNCPGMKIGWAATEEEEAHWFWIQMNNHTKVGQKRRRRDMLEPIPKTSAPIRNIPEQDPELVETQAQLWATAERLVDLTNKHSEHVERLTGAHAESETSFQ